jgi:MFS family permease
MILPVIAEEFGVSKSQVQWVAASNTIVWVSFHSGLTVLIELTLKGSLQIIAGRCCDIYGRKRAFHVGMACFVIATFLSAFMPVS